MKEMLLKKFMFHFVNDQRKDKKFCFILGAGASKQSGIRTGSELAKLWVDELIQMESESAINNWIQKENIPLDDLAHGYSKIYDKRFEVDPRDGFSFLEKEMENIDPSCGYSVLANILSTTEHKIVITTNFDSLCEDALFIYTQKKPLVVGHEALANFIRPFGSRPVVIKIHRDLFLSPKSTNEDTCSLADGFKKNLTDIFKYYTPIVIGYGGNDGSLMNYLSELSAIEGGLFWFYRKDNPVSERISKIIEKFNGYAVPIDGFDELMIQLGDKLNYAPMDNNIIESANTRAKKYRDQFDEITKKSSLTGDTKQALKNIVKRTEKKNWWYYQQLIDNEIDPLAQEELYKKYIDQLPRSNELVGNFAVFLYSIREKYEEAEKYFKKSFELDPKNPVINGSYANFLSSVRENHDEAEKYYKISLELGPNLTNNNGNYAFFLYKIRKNYDEAEKYYKKALEIDSNHSNNNENYAVFLHNIRKNYEEAEKYYKKTLELDPNNAYYNNNYAIFLHNIRKNYEEAEKYFKKALELDSNNAINNGNYAQYLIDVERLKEAHNFIEIAFKINKEEKVKQLSLELHFCCFAVYWKEYPDAKQNVQRLLEEGIRSPSWKLDGVIKVSAKLNHPEIEEVKRLAKIISEEK